MKKTINNLTIIIILILFTVAVNMFSDFTLTADGIKGSNSILKILISLMFVSIWILGSFYNSYIKGQKSIAFLSLAYFLIFAWSFIYNGIFLIFSIMIAPLLPVLDLFKIVAFLKNGNILAIVFSLLAFFLINLGVAFVGTSINKHK